MSTLLRHLRRGACLTLLALALPAQAGWFDDGCRFSAERSAAIDATGAERVEIVGRAGDLRVHPGTGTLLTGHGRACVSREEYLAETRVLARRDGKVLRLWVEAPDSFVGFGVFYASLDLVVDVPAGLPVSISDTSGDLRVEDLPVTRITDSSGDIRAVRLTADVEINDSSGDIRVEDAAGRVRVTDSSGDIVIRGAREVVIPTDSSGDIVVSHVASDVRIESDSSGDVTVTDVGRNVDLLADSSGDVHVTGVRGAVRLP